jgi:hypothetical protein
VQRQFAIVAGAQPLQALPSITPQRLEIIDALGCEQALDPVDVRHAFSDQPLALAVSAPRVLPLDRGHLHHVAGGPIPAPLNRAGFSGGS